MIKLSFATNMQMGVRVKFHVFITTTDGASNSWCDCLSSPWDAGWASERVLANRIGSLVGHIAGLDGVDKTRRPRRWPERSGYD